MIYLLMATSSLHYLIFTSLAVQRLSAQQLAHLCSVLKLNIESLNLTGISLYMESRLINKVEGRFMHVLEGDESDLLSFYNHMSRDRWHRSHVLLSLQPCDEKSFSGWSMGFDYDQLADVGQIANCFHLDQTFLQQLSLMIPDRRKALLQSFYRVNMSETEQEKPDDMRKLF